MTIYQSRAKRVFDLFASILALLVLSPLLLLTAILIKLEDGGSAFFLQSRVGKDLRPFRLFKFRSMPVNAGNLPSAQASSLPITRVGRVIRRSNIDELPQLWNIARGDMSVVGPRPALESQAELLRLRHANGASRVRPGLTGLAQINSYDGMPETEKAELDGAYSRQITFREDARIILRTFGYLMKKPPVY